MAPLEKFKESELKCDFLTKIKKNNNFFGTIFNGIYT